MSYPSSSSDPSIAAVTDTAAAAAGNHAIPHRPRIPHGAASPRIPHGAAAANHVVAAAVDHAITGAAVVGLSLRQGAVVVNSCANRRSVVGDVFYAYKKPPGLLLRQLHANKRDQQISCWWCHPSTEGPSALHKVTAVVEHCYPRVEPMMLDLHLGLAVGEL